MCNHNWIEYNDCDLREQYLEQLHQKQVCFYNYATKVLQIEKSHSHEPHIAQCKTILERKMLDLIIHKADMLYIVTGVCNVCGEYAATALLATHKPYPI